MVVCQCSLEPIPSDRNLYRSEKLSDETCRWMRQLRQIIDTDVTQGEKKNLIQAWREWRTRPSRSERAWKRKATTILAMLSTTGDDRLNLSPPERLDFIQCQLELARFVLRIGGTSVFDNESPTENLRKCILKILEQRKDCDEDDLGNLASAAKHIEELGVIGDR